MGIGLGFGVIGAVAWASIARSNHREVEQLNREFQQAKLERKKEYEEWLAAQPYDDEEAA